MTRQLLIRLNKYIADTGFTSRRKADDLIANGKVKVDGKIIKTLGLKIDPNNQVVTVNGTVLGSVEKIYLILNKPRGYLTTLHDPSNRKTVMDLLKGINIRIYPVGRLDYNSEGLLILTNDGDFAQNIIHPKFNILKTYEVKVSKKLTNSELKNLGQKITVDGEQLSPHSVRIIERLPTKTWLEFRLHEGKNREIRRICKYHGLLVDKLRRVAIGGLSVKNLPVGKFQFLTKKKLLAEISKQYISPLKNLF